MAQQIDPLAVVILAGLGLGITILGAILKAIYRLWKN